MNEQIELSPEVLDQIESIVRKMIDLLAEEDVHPEIAASACMSLGRTMILKFCGPAVLLAYATGLKEDAEQITKNSALN